METDFHKSKKTDWSLEVTKIHIQLRCTSDKFLKNSSSTPESNPASVSSVILHLEKFRNPVYGAGHWPELRADPESASTIYILNTFLLPARVLHRA